MICRLPWLPMMASAREDLDLSPSPNDRFYKLRDGIARIRGKHRLPAIDFSGGLQVDDWEKGQTQPGVASARTRDPLAINRDGSVDPCVFYQPGELRASIKASSLVEVLASPHLARLHEYRIPRPIPSCLRPLDHPLETPEAKEELGAAAFSPERLICGHGDIGDGILEYDERCREVAGEMVRTKHEFEPGTVQADLEAATAPLGCPST